MKKKIFKGIGLPVILSACGILALATGVVAAYAMNNLGVVTRTQLYDQAHYGAYSGIQWALDAVSVDPRTSSGSVSDVLGDLQFPSNPALTCKVYIFSNLPTAARKCSTAPDGTAIPPGAIYVVADATVVGHPTTRSSQLTALCTPRQFYFDNALFGDTQVKVLNGARVDCYNTYPYATYDPTTAPLKKATVASNSEASSTVIDISGPGTLVDGDAYVGPAGPLSAINLPTSTDLTGDKKNLSTFKSLKLDHPPGNPDQNYPGGLTVSSSLTFQAGKTYMVDGDLTIASGGSIKVTPPATPSGVPQENDAFVFVKGNVIVQSGGQLGDPVDKPETLQIYVPKSSGSHSLTMTGGTACCAVAGPDLQASITGGAEIYGAVIADSITLDGSKLHFDTNLVGNALGPMGWSVGGFDSDRKENRGSGSFAGPATTTSSTTTSSTTTSSTTTSSTTTSSTTTSSTTTSSTTTSARTTTTSRPRTSNSTMLP